MPSSRFADHDSRAGASGDTRERILDVALELFTEHGYDSTSLRQIAERLGLTKAALYYHFESKEDLLQALHLRLQEFGRDTLSGLDNGPLTLERWAALLDEMVDQVLSQRPLFLLHKRNEAAIEKLHRRDHDAEDDDIENRLRRVLADPGLPLGDRVRMAASVGVVFSGLLLPPEVFAGASNQEVGNLVRDVLHGVLGRGPDPKFPDRENRSPAEE